MVATVKLDSIKRDVLKIIAIIEKRDIKNILGELDGCDKQRYLEN
jgi:hypothetical protein